MGSFVGEVWSRGEPSAVDHDVASDVGGLVAGQEQGWVSDVVRPAASTQQEGVFIMLDCIFLTTPGLTALTPLGRFRSIRAG